MKFTIYMIGHKAEKFYSLMIKEYAKRLSRYCKIRLVNVKDYVQLEKKLSDRSFIIHISPSGRSLSSKDFSKQINQYAVSSNSDISFIIDSETNTNTENTNTPTYNDTLSLSKMTMSPDLQASILYEQIYRAYRILNNEPYHK